MNYEVEYEFGYDDSTKYECDHGTTGNCYECKKLQDEKDAERAKKNEKEIDKLIEKIRASGRKNNENQ